MAMSNIAPRHRWRFLITGARALSRSHGWQLGMALYNNIKCCYPELLEGITTSGVDPRASDDNIEKCKEYVIGVWSGSNGETSE